MSKFYFIIFAGIDSIGHVFDSLRFVISLIIDSKSTFFNEKHSFAETLSLIFKMLGWLLYLFIAFRIGSSITSCPRKYSSQEKCAYDSMFKFLTALLKKSLKISAIFSSSLMMLLFSINVMLSVKIVFSENNGLTVFQTFLLSQIADGLKFSKYAFLFVF